MSLMSDRPGEPAYFANLNPPQRQAVETLDGPVLVLAGAGTGKTRVLTTRLGHILMTGRAYPSQVLAVTFTNKAAREMRDRLERLIGADSEGMWLGTFHAIAARILRRNAEAVGLKSNFTILDTDDQIRLIKQLLAAEGIDDKRSPPRAVLATIERWKDRGLTPDKVDGEDAGDLAEGRMQALYRQYQDRLRVLNATDFGDLLLHNLTIFTSQPAILAEYQRKFRYLLVDEYQDTNVAQYLWLRLLAQAHRNICCVGDDDQCVAAGTLITMANGSLKPVEQVQPGENVLSSYGSGDFRAAPVLRAHHVSRTNRRLIRIRTETGRELLSTAEHSHFADVVLHESPQRFFTYLMFKRGSGYRLGTSQIYTQGQRHPVIGYQQRCLQEHADAVWLVRAFDNEVDAREYEHVLSLSYAVTTFPFMARKGGSVNGLVHDQARLDRLHTLLRGQGRIDALMADHGLDPDQPHHVPQSAPGRRRNLTLTLNADRRGATPMHRVALSGNDTAGAEALRELGLSARAYKRNPNNWRYETVFRDFEKLEEIRTRLETRFDLTIVRKANILGKPLTVRPAANIVPGMVVPTETGRHEVVTSVEQLAASGEVYDLDVAGTHNFIANGIVTHNSIYGWRGAEVGNILRFEADFPGAVIIRLEQNYRSTPEILAAAGHLIAHNAGRLGKTLWTAGEAGERVRAKGMWDGEEEARWVADEIENEQRRGTRLSEIAILVRASFQMREFEERFITTGIPYRVIGGPRFYERQEIRDALAYLRLIYQPDDDLAFERIVNTPRRGIGNATMQILHQLGRAAGIPLMEASRRVIETDELKPAARKAVALLVRDFDRWRRESDRIMHTELAQIVLDESGYTAMWQADKTPEAPGRLENLKELIVGMAEFETLAGFLEHVSLVMDNAADTSGDLVSLMTLHAAKGLEFGHVFLPGWEEGLFPHQRAMDESGQAGLEEERRLAYVGLTRAKLRANVSYAANRRIHGQWQSSLPSRFVEELPQDQIEAESATGMYGMRAPQGRGAFDDIATSSFGGYRRIAQPMGGGPREGREIRAVGGFAEGDRVFHQKFGAGTVREVEDAKLTIDFDHAGEKRVMDSFVQKA